MKEFDSVKAFFQIAIVYLIIVFLTMMIVMTGCTKGYDEIINFIRY